MMIPIAIAILYLATIRYDRYRHHNDVIIIVVVVLLGRQLDGTYFSAICCSIPILVRKMRILKEGACIAESSPFTTVLQKLE